AAGQLAVPVETAKERRGLVISDAAGGQVGVEIPLQLVVYRHLVMLAALLMQAQPPALALLMVVADLHGEDGAERVLLEQRQSEQFSVAELRALLNVPKGKLERFADFNKYALQPALKELNALSEYAVEVGTVKQAQRVTHLTLLWVQKDLAGRLAALR